MLIKTTIPEIIETILRGKIKLQDNSVCGNCSKCGECCTNFLPVCQKEIDIIKKYVITKNIKPQTQMLVMQNRLTCPYYDGKKCLIYEVRPLICKEFYCYKKPSVEIANKFEKDTYIPVDMWAIAKDIEKIRSRFYGKV